MMRSLGIKLGLLLAAAVTLSWIGWDGLHEPAPTTRTGPALSHPVAVPASPRPPAPSPASLPSAQAPRREVPVSLDLNRATAEELATLPGVGEIIAQRIVARRQNSGLYHTVQQLLDVRGIGETRLARIRPLVHVSRDGTTVATGAPALQSPRTGRRGS